jgi:cytochrome c5
MPARGGNPGLTDDSIRNIIAYVRTLDGFVPSAGEASSAAAPEAAPAESSTTAEEPATDPADLDTSFTPIDTSGLAGLAPSSPDGEAEAVEPASDGRPGEALYSEICATNAPLCDYLLASVTAGVADADLTAQLTNGLSAFAAGNTSGVNIPAGGGLFPPMTAPEIEALISHVKSVAGIETEAAPPESEAEAAPAETEAEAAPESAGRTGQALSDALCSTNAPLCDYLREQLAAGTPQADLAAQLVNGLSMFAAGNTSGINIPAGGGLFPPMTEAEVNTLLEFLSAE